MLQAEKKALKGAPIGDRMTQELRDRVTREQRAFDEDSQIEEGHRLRRKLWHVFSCPNTQFYEEQHSGLISLRCKNAVVLDYGCGTGWDANPYVSCEPKMFIAFDISSVAVQRARQALAGRGEFLVMDAHRTALPDQSCDLVVSRAILHHLDFEIAIREVHRLLKKGGYALFAEPLGDNPAARIWRACTAKFYTPDERPLSGRQIQWADACFDSSHHSFCGFFSTVTGLITSLLVKSANNVFLRAADRLDRLVAKTPLRFWMRYVYLVWRK